MDTNGNGSGSSPGEGLADVHAILRGADSCLGRGYFKSVNCSGYGDPCTDCTGFRDADFAKHESGAPVNLGWILSHCVENGGRGPCLREVHCEGYIVAESAWDLFARAFQSEPFSYNRNTALELTTRLFFLGSQPVTGWYQCTPPFGGCTASGGYFNLLAADDDNGSLADGTPHMTAIFKAFNGHEIACDTPAPVNSGCAGGPDAAPVVTATPVDQGAALSWAPVPGAAGYIVYRTEGVQGCDFGKAKVGETNETRFLDQGLLNDFRYFYTVLPVGSNRSCFGRASTCVSVVPEVTQTDFDLQVSDQQACAPPPPDARSGAVTSRKP
jgi:hypothetical protein